MTVENLLLLLVPVLVAAPLGALALLAAAVWGRRPGLAAWACLAATTGCLFWAALAPWTAGPGPEPWAWTGPKLAKEAAFGLASLALVAASADTAARGLPGLGARTTLKAALLYLAVYALTLASVRPALQRHLSRHAAETPAGAK